MIIVAAFLHWNTFTNSALHTGVFVDVISVVCNHLNITGETQIQFYTMFHCACLKWKVFFSLCIINLSIHDI